MKFFFCGCLFLVLFVSPVVSHSPEDPIPGITDLTSANFESFISSASSAFVEFYAPWCGHCKSLAETLVEVAEKVVSTSSAKGKVVLGKVNCEEQRDLCQMHEVRGYPTLKMFSGSKSSKDYSGGRSVDDILSFFTDETSVRFSSFQPNNVFVYSSESFKDSEEDVCRFVKFYAPWCGHCKKLAPIYESLANVFVNEKNVVIGEVDATIDGELAEKYDVRGYPTLLLFESGSSEGEKYAGSREFGDLVEYVNEKCGTERNEDGTLKETAGRVGVLDEVVSGCTPKCSLGEIENVATSLTGNDAVNSAYYIRVVKMIQKKGSDYPSKESARLQRMLSGGNVAVDHVDAFTKKMNVLRQFEAPQE